MMRLFAATLFFSMILGVQTTSAQAVSQTTRLEHLKQRILQLEERQKEIQEWYTKFYLLGDNRVQPFLSDKISLGGYFEGGITNIRGPDTPTQTSANHNALGINLAVDFNEDTRFIGQTLTIVEIPLLNFHNNPNFTPSKRQYAGLAFGQILAQGFLEYSSTDIFNIQSGLGYVPFGIAYQQREPFLFHKHGGPQLLANDDGTDSSLASPLWMGLHIYGLLPFQKEKVGYNLYTVPPTTNVGMIGGGGRLWWATSESTKAGLSVQYGERKQGSYISRGLDIDYVKGDFGVIAEYAKRVSTAYDSDSESYYIEPYYKFLDNKWLVFLDVQYLKLPLRIDVVAQIADPIEKRYYGGGLNWLPISTIRVRLNYLRHDYVNETEIIQEQKRDYDTAEISVAIAF